MTEPVAVVNKLWTQLLEKIMASNHTADSSLHRDFPGKTNSPPAVVAEWARALKNSSRHSLETPV